MPGAGERAASHAMRTTIEWTGLRPALRALSLALAIAAGLVASEASAQSRVCRQLEAQLAGLSGGGTFSAQARRYDRAIEQQRLQLAKGEQRYRRAACGSLFGSRGQGCDALGRSLDVMERNLSDLQRARSRMGGDPRRERARIQAALDANDCRVSPRERRVEREARREGGSLFEQLLGGGIRQAERPERRGFEEFDGSARVRTTLRNNGGIFTVDPAPAAGGNYRTLCVRTCDGYYWPISYASSQGDFQRDEQNCQTMCPGTEVKLYSHRVPDEESESMVDLYGAPYTALSTAFKYRDASFAKPESCGCAAARKNFSIVAGAAPDSAAPMSFPVETPESIMRPEPRPDRGAPPETLATSEELPRAEDPKPPSARKPEAGEPAVSAERKVRVVGPAYLPDPQEAAGQPVRGPTAVQ